MYKQEHMHVLCDQFSCFRPCWSEANFTSSSSGTKYYSSTFAFLTSKPTNTRTHSLICDYYKSNYHIQELNFRGFTELFSPLYNKLLENSHQREFKKVYEEKSRTFWSLQVNHATWQLHQVVRYHVEIQHVLNQTMRNEHLISLSHETKSSCQSLFTRNVLRRRE